MKKQIYILLAAVAMAVPFATQAQMRTSYFMEGSTFRTDMNPALAPTRGYINFPALGGLGIGLNNNFLSISNFVYKTDNGPVLFLNKAVDKDKFLSKLPRNNAVDFDTSVQLLGFGAHSKRYFWNAGLNLRATADVNIPRDFFSLITNLGQGTYDMKDMHVGANAYLEAYIGAAIPIKERFTVGFRVKGLVGLAQANVDIDRMSVNVTDEKVVAEMRGSMRGNTIISKSDYPTGEGINFEDIISFDDFSAANIKSGGVAVDIGAEARFFDDHLRVSAALTDLGFICWNKASTFNGSIDGGFSYEGYDFDNDDVLTDSDFNINTTPSSGSYTKRLNMSMNFGAEYAILRNRISFGVLSHTKFADGVNYTELTASVNFKPVNWITASFSHTFLNHNELGVFGCALNIHPSAFNLFIGADFIGLKAAKLTVDGTEMIMPATMKSMNVYFGLGFSIGRAKYSKAYKDDMAAKQARAERRRNR